jgi:hypothetical protein
MFLLLAKKGARSDATVRKSENVATVDSSSKVRSVQVLAIKCRPCLRHGQVKTAFVSKAFATAEFSNLVGVEGQDFLNRQEERQVFHFASLRNVSAWLRQARDRTFARRLRRSSP